MKLSIKKRIALGAAAIATVGAVSTLVAGVTFGLFSATGSSPSSTFTSGTVSLTSDATFSCNIPSYIVPGDSGSCTANATYTGNVSAFIGLTTSTTGALFTGEGTDDSGINALQVTITDNNTATYADNGANLYVGTDGAAAATRTFTVAWTLPSGADNSYQNKTATVTLTVEAVQSAHNGYATTNGLPGGPACAAGPVCAGIGAWS